MSLYYHSTITLPPYLTLVVRACLNLGLKFRANVQKCLGPTAPDQPDLIFTCRAFQLSPYLWSGTSLLV